MLAVDGVEEACRTPVATAETAGRKKSAAVGRSADCVLPDGTATAGG